MATLEQHIYNIKNVGSHANPSTSNELSESLIAHWIHTYRTLVINQMWGKKDSRVDSLLFQNFGCLQLTHVDRAECPCLDITWDCTVAKVSIPRPVVIGGKPMLGLTLLDGTTPLMLVDVGVVHASRYGRWTGSIDKGFLDWNNEDGMVDLYILTDNDDLTYVRARGISEDPTKVVTSELDNQGNCQERCFDIEKDSYPMSNLITANVYALIMEKELRVTMAGFDDLLNNNQEDRSLLQVQQTLKALDVYAKRSNPGTKQTVQGRTKQG